MGGARKPRGRPPAGWYSLRSVLARQAEMEGRKYAAAKPLKDEVLRWGGTRTKIEAPAGDRLITRREAASMLNVSQPRVSILVSAGTLFAWQEHPGKPGCPLYLSERQVQRYAAEVMRCRRRDAFDRRGEKVAPARTRGSDEDDRRAAEPDKPKSWANEDWEEWRWERWLSEDRATGGAARRDHGLYFSTAQAAKELGVSTAAIGTLRRRGRLTGHRVKTSRGPSARQWWFYLKDDVYRLAADPEYRRKHAAAELAKSADERPPTAAELEAMYEANRWFHYQHPVDEIGWDPNIRERLRPYPRTVDWEDERMV